MSKLPLFNYRSICLLCNYIFKHLYKLAMILICSPLAQLFPRPYLPLVLEVLSTRYIIKMQKIADPNNLCQEVYKIVKKIINFPCSCNN